MNEARISPSEFRKALALAASVTERRNTSPVLGTIKIEINRTHAVITATDLDIEASASIEVAELIGPPFSFLIGPRLISDASRFAESLISISKAGDILTIKADDMEVQVRSLMPVEDWPALKPVEHDQAADFNEGHLLKAMSAAAVSISTEETRYYLNGIYFHDAGDGALTLVSTDGHRLTRYATGNPWKASEGMIVPRKTCSVVMSKLAKDGNKSVLISTSKHRISFMGEGWKIFSKCIDGTFPDYKRIIPEPSDKISFAVTAAALRRFPKTGQRTCAIKIDAGAGKMSMRDPDGMTATMPVTGKGEAAGFNLKYLKAFANLSGTIQISGAKSGDPFRVLSEDPRLLQVLMPMRV